MASARGSPFCKLSALTTSAESTNPGVDKNLLKIPEEFFLGVDFDKPIDLPRKYDLAISLEVAEHLRASAADLFVQSPANLSGCVLFSAAIPLQGSENHVNEQ